MFNHTLVAGDIVLTNNVSLKSLVKSKAQKSFTGGSFTHVAIYIGDGRFIEAVKTGVRFFSITGVAFSDKNNFRVLRYKDDVSFEGLTTNGIAKYSFMNYNTRGIQNFVFKLGNKTEYQVFCSQLATRIYEDYGIFLFEKEHDKITPADFENSNSFSDVTDQIYIELATLPDVVYLIYDLEKQIKQSILTQQEEIVCVINKELNAFYKETIPSMGYAFNILIQFDSLINNDFLQVLFKGHDNEVIIETLKRMNLSHDAIELLSLYLNIIKTNSFSSIEELEIFIKELDRNLDILLDKNGYYDLYKIMILQESKNFELLAFSSQTEIDAYKEAIKKKISMHEGLIQRFNIEYQEYRKTNFISLNKYATSLFNSTNFSQNLIRQMQSIL